MNTSERQGSAPTGKWARLRRVCFRFALLYFLLFFFPKPFTPADFMPRIPGVNQALYSSWRRVLDAVATILGWQGVDTRFSYGGGDALADYLRAACCVALAVLLALIWSATDRARHDHPRLAAALRVYLRFVLGLTLVSYGLAKTIGQQFTFSSIRLFQPVGELEPMSLLWLYMGYAKGYTLFTAAVELLAGGMLLFRRTSTLGALLALLAMSHVVATNLSFDVQVKLYSIHLWLVAVFLLLPDLQAIWRFFVLRRPSSLDNGTSLVVGRRGAALSIAVKVLVVAVFLNGHRQHVEMLGRQRTSGIDTALQGTYEVLHGDDAVPPTSEWERVVISQNGEFAVIRQDNSVQFYRGEATGGELILKGGDAGSRGHRFTYRRVEAELVLTGRGGLIEMRQVDQEALPLLARRFRWVRR